MSSKYLVGLSILFFFATKYLPYWLSAIIVVFGITLCLNTAWKCFRRIRKGKDFDPTECENEEDAKMSIDEVKSSMWLNLIFAAIFIAVLIWPLFKSSNNSSIEKDVAAMNADCPANLGGYNITSVSYDKDFLILNFQLDAKYDVPEFRNLMQTNNGNNPEGDFNMALNFCRADNPIKEIAKKYHKGLKLNYYFKNIGDGFTTIIPYDEIIRVENMPQAEINSTMLNNFVATTNRNLPDTISDGYVQTKSYLEDRYFVLEFSVDESILDFSEYRTHQGELRQELISDIVTSTNKQEFSYPMNNCIATNNYGIMYRWIPSISNDTLSVEVSPEEMQSYFSKH